MKHIFAALLALMLILSAIAPASAQVRPPIYTLTVANPVVFLASSLNGSVSGPNGTEFRLLLVNMSSFDYFPILTGIFNGTAPQNFSRFMNADYYPPGRYTLNLTADNETVLFVQITLVYNQAFVVWQKIRDIVETLTTMSYAIQNHEQRIGDIEDHNRRTDWILFICLLLVIIMFFVILYFVILRVLKARYARSLARQDYNQRKMHGLDCDPVYWADLEQNLGPEDTHPNLNPIPQILKNAGVPAALADECLLDVFADFGMAGLMEHEITWLEKRKLDKQKKAKAKAVKP